VSISATFTLQVLRQNPFAKKLQTQIVSSKHTKAAQKLSYEKFARKILVKFTPLLVLTTPL
jgi:hypothetical protein